MSLRICSPRRRGLIAGYKPSVEEGDGIFDGCFWLARCASTLEYVGISTEFMMLHHVGFSLVAVVGMYGCFGLLLGALGSID